MFDKVFTTPDQRILFNTVRNSRKIKCSLWMIITNEYEALQSLDSLAISLQNCITNYPSLHTKSMIIYKYYFRSMNFVSLAKILVNGHISRIQTGCKMIHIQPHFDIFRYTKYQHVILSVILKHIKYLPLIHL